LFCVSELLVAHKTWIAPRILHSVQDAEKLWDTCGRLSLPPRLALPFPQ